VVSLRISGQPLHRVNIFSSLTDSLEVDVLGKGILYSNVVDVVYDIR